MSVKYYPVILFILIVFCAGILRLPDAIAEEPTGSTQQLAPAEIPIENIKPLISRNPFVNAQHGRMSKTPPGSGTNTSSGSIKKDKVDDPLRGLRLKGLLIRDHKSAALLNHKIVEMGDIIGDYTVTDITVNGVDLSKGDIVIRLTIE